ncbi:hypothetical protein A5816_002917 [Enterococcus sp. 3G1_DIV0629]|nr:phage holin [Enterococcus sp. 3G1_DIV0629]OTO22245.1 hypothetical protein A5816_002917 [Enterococcus sp. 3G1_DIV0629]
MKLNNSMHDIVKWVVSVVLPALTVLVGVDWENPMGMNTLMWLSK